MNRLDDDDDFLDPQISMEDLAKLSVVEERKFTWPAGEKIEMKNSFSMVAMLTGKEEMKEEYLKRENFFAHYIGFLEPNENLAIVKRNEDDSGNNDIKE